MSQTMHVVIQAGSVSLIFHLYTWFNWLECKWYVCIKQKFSKTNGWLLVGVEIFTVLLAQNFHLVGAEILNDNVVGTEILTVPLAQNFHFCFVSSCTFIVPPWTLFNQVWNGWGKKLFHLTQTVSFWNCLKFWHNGKCPWPFSRSEAGV